MVAYLADPAVPRTDDGRILLCGFCQRDMFFSGGMIPMLARDVKRLARQSRHDSVISAFKRKDVQRTEMDVRIALAMGTLVARRHLAEERWPEGQPICPACASDDPYILKSGKWRCRKCRVDFTELTRTRLSFGKTTPQVYLSAIWAFGKNGAALSAHEFSSLARIQKPTGWRLKSIIEGGWRNA